MSSSSHSISSQSSHLHKSEQRRMQRRGTAVGLYKLPSQMEVLKQRTPVSVMMMPDGSNTVLQRAKQILIEQHGQWTEETLDQTLELLFTQQQVDRSDKWCQVDEPPTELLSLLDSKELQINELSQAVKSYELQLKREKLKMKQLRDDAELVRKDIQSELKSYQRLKNKLIQEQQAKSQTSQEQSDVCSEQSSQSFEQLKLGVDFDSKINSIVDLQASKITQLILDGRVAEPQHSEQQFYSLGKTKTQSEKTMTTVSAEGTTSLWHKVFQLQQKHRESIQNQY